MLIVYGAIGANSQAAAAGDRLQVFAHQVNPDGFMAPLLSALNIIGGIKHFHGQGDATGHDVVE